MKLAAISMVRNEADVIESFVRHNGLWADVLYIADHASTDETGEILQKLQAEGLPLRLSEVRGAAQVQSEIITSLLYQAVSEGADLIVPLDADEFLLPEGVPGAVRCREALARLDTNLVYALDWVRYVPEEGQGFLLARRARRERRPEPLTKLIVGAGAAQAVPLIISQGNHKAVMRPEGKGAGSPQAIAAGRAEGVLIAHYPWRSAAQAQTKAATGWLANVAKYSRYTRKAHHWRTAFRQILAGHHLAPEPLREPEKAARWPREETPRLLYTPKSGNTDVLRKVLLAAEELAEECREKAVRIEQPLVSILLSFEGDLAAFGRSLTSAVQDSYPAKEYIVLAVQAPQELLPQLEELLAAQPVESIALLTDAEGLLGLRQYLQGDYVQYLPEGYCLRGERLTKMLASLDAQPEMGLLLSGVEEGHMLAELQNQDKLFPIDMQGEVFLPGDGSQAAQAIRGGGQYFAGGSAAAISRRGIWLESGLLDTLSRGAWPGEADVQAALLLGQVYGYIAEPLLSMPEAGP